MDARRKVYHKTDNNTQRVHEIRESIRVRSGKRKIVNSSKMPDRHRNLEDVRKLMGESSPYLDSDYEAKCTFLNGLCRTIKETKIDALTENEFFEDLCHLMLKFLRDDHPCIRAMCFHIVRKCTMNERNLVVILTSHVDIYIVRAVDLQMENQTERGEAFKLIIWMLKIYEKSNLKKLIDNSAAQKNGKKYAFPKSIMQPIISIALAAFEGQQSKGKDKMSLPCVGLFLEFCLTEPLLILEMAGTDWLVKVLTGVSCMSRRIVLLASQVLIAWLDSPTIRIKAHLHLVMEQIFAPLVEFGLFQKRGSMVANDAVNESFHMNDFLENFKCSFLCLIRSWPGLFACAAVGPNSNILSSSPFRLLDYLGLGTVTNDNLVRIRDTIVDLCCDFVDVPYASKTFESWEEALTFYKSMHLPDKYKSNLKNDFIIAENEARLKNDTERRKHTVDLLAAFRVLSQFVLINAQLPLSLARLILAMPDSSSGLKATLLMADMLRQAPSHVPVGWRAPVLSMPTLVQSACESLSQSHAVAAINGNFDINAVEQYTFLHATNAELVLTRFDKLNQSWIRSASNSSTVLKECDLQLFAPHMSEPVLQNAPNTMKKSKSEISFRGGASITRNTSPDIYEDENPGDFETTVLRGKYDRNKLMLMDDTDDYDYSWQVTRDLVVDEEEENAKKMFVDEKGQFDWNYIEYYVENVEKDGFDKLVKEFQSNSMEDHVKNMFHFLSPSELHNHKRTMNRQHVIVIKSFIKLLLKMFPSNEGIRQDYVPILQKYVANFRAVLEERSHNHAYFAPRNLSLNFSMLHFAVIGTFTMTSHGLAILNDVGVLHMYVDMMSSSSPLEFTKLIVSSLDYSSEGLARVILRKALTSTSENSRKWTTRFLSVLASSDLAMFSDWGIQLLLRQLADESSKVVRHTIRLLNRWLPEHPSKNLRKVEWSLFGEAGDLLKVHLYSVESECANEEEEVRETIRYWMKEFNSKYLRIIDEEMKEMMFRIKRSIDGGFSRSSSDRPDTSLGVHAPLHLFGALGSHETGKRLLLEENVPEDLLRCIGNQPASKSCFEDLKSSILALASIGSTNSGFEILPLESVPTIIKIAEEHSVLTVRGVAFWALATLSQCIEGAKRVAAFGWECNRFRYATDLAKGKVSEEEVPGGSVSSSWRPARKITMQQHRHSSVLEVQFNGKQNRAKSESALVRRGHSKGRRRSRSESDVQEVAPKKSSRTEQACVQRLWNSELYLYKSSGTSDSSSAPYHKRTATSSSSAHHLQEEMLLTVSPPPAHLADELGKSAATSRMSTDRRRANTTNSLFEESEDTVKTRASTVARCIRDGLKIPFNQLEAEGVLADTIMEPHFSCRLREKYQLSSFRVRACLIINRHVGEPVRYIFMSKEEERNFADYRRQVLRDPWLFNELQKEDNAVKKTINVVPLQTVALPAEIEIICGNIFPSLLKQKPDPIFSNFSESNLEEVEDRGARTGHARSGIHIQPHSTYRCFHCSSNEDKVRTYPHPDAPMLRKEVLGQVDMLEIKEYPVKRLIGLRQLHPWLFEWPCMYADVLELLDEYRFKPHSRAFLQQIFYDALQL